MLERGTHILVAPALIVALKDREVIGRVATVGVSEAIRVVLPGHLVALPDRACTRRRQWVARSKAVAAKILLRPRDPLPEQVPVGVAEFELGRRVKERVELVADLDERSSRLQGRRELDDHLLEDRALVFVALALVALLAPEHRVGDHARYRLLGEGHVDGREVEVEAFDVERTDGLFDLSWSWSWSWASGRGRGERGHGRWALLRSVDGRGGRGHERLRCREGERFDSGWRSRKGEGRVGRLNPLRLAVSSELLRELTHS